jgi:hypothetical protein
LNSSVKTVLLLGVFVAGFSVGRKTIEDDNARPVYGSLGLPANCRAYIQAAVNGYRSKQYTADETLNGVERNCGIGGHSWKNMRND